MYDRFLCSLMASTWPNRYYKWSAQSGGRRTTPAGGPGGNQWETLFDRADRPRRRRARYYNSDLPFSAVWGARGAPGRGRSPLLRRLRRGHAAEHHVRRPAVPGRRRRRRLSADEHPLGDVRARPGVHVGRRARVHGVAELGAVALFIVYDEWGGFFDHVRPPSVPDARASSTDATTSVRWASAFRPSVISPFRPKAARAVQPLACGFESIIKLITYRFGLGGLNPRRARAEHRPEHRTGRARTSSARIFPTRPDRSTKPCTLGGGDVVDGQQTHASDLAALEELAERYGVPSYEGKLGDIFTLPDTIQQAVLDRPRSPARPVRVRAHGDPDAHRRRAGGGRRPGARGREPRHGGDARDGRAARRRAESTRRWRPPREARPAGRRRPRSSAPSCCTRSPRGCGRGPTSWPS